MLLALKRFDQTAIHLSLASVPSRTSLPRVPEDAGKINATPSQPAGRAASQPGLAVSGVLLGGELAATGRAGREDGESRSGFQRGAGVRGQRPRTAAEKPPRFA